MCATKGRAPWSKTQTLRLTNSYRLQYNHPHVHEHYQIQRARIDLSIWTTRYQFNREKANNVFEIDNKWNAVFCLFSVFSPSIILYWLIVVGFLWACYGYRKYISYCTAHSMWMTIGKWREPFAAAIQWASKCSRWKDDFLFEFSLLFFHCVLHSSLSIRVSLSLFDEALCVSLYGFCWPDGLQ